jgi:hypothetical protein
LLTECMALLFLLRQDFMDFMLLLVLPTSEGMVPGHLLA